jgi:hypothetical protein
MRSAGRKIGRWFRELTLDAASYWGMRRRFSQELRTALLIAFGFGVACFGAAFVAAKLIGHS